jgi:hypothetical protein
MKETYEFSSLKITRSINGFCSILGLGLWMWILACPASLAEDDDPNALNQQDQLIARGKYQEAIPIAKERDGRKDGYQLDLQVQAQALKFRSQDTPPRHQSD